MPPKQPPSTSTSTSISTSTPAKKLPATTTTASASSSTTSNTVSTSPVTGLPEARATRKSSVMNGSRTAAAATAAAASPDETPERTNGRNSNSSNNSTTGSTITSPSQNGGTVNSSLRVPINKESVTTTTPARSIVVTPSTVGSSNTTSTSTSTVGTITTNNTTTTTCTEGPTSTTNRSSSSNGTNTNDDTIDNNHNNDDEEINKTKQLKKTMSIFFTILVTDAIISILLLYPKWSWIQHYGGMDDTTNNNIHHYNHYTLHGTTIDIGILTIVRIFICIGALLIDYYRGIVQPEFFPLTIYHPNGDRKSRDELEQEQTEEGFVSFVQRYVCRCSFFGEIISVVCQIVCIIKSLARMNVEIGTLHDKMNYHPLFWLALLFCSIYSLIEASYLHDACLAASKLGKQRIDKLEGNGNGTNGTGTGTTSIFRTLSSNLLTPLLSDQDNTNDDENINTVEEGGDIDDAATSASTNATADDIRGTSDITGDCNYHATLNDLITMCWPDRYYILLALKFLLLAAIAQVYIPRFLGNILDDLSKDFSNRSADDPYRNKSMWEIPNFMNHVQSLVTASILAGVFAGARGSIFTVVGCRINVRLRVKLLDSLLTQDIGFFDTTKTGDITSRLSSDTTLVGDQISLNVNVMLRSFVQAAGVLIFMFHISWQLSIIAFVSVPLITVLSKWYGNYIRSLTKVMQTKLADGNSTCEAALGSMATVRAFDASENVLNDFEISMKKYLHLSYKNAIAYYGFATLTTSLPELIFAIVVYYGGMLVRNGDMTSGKLVSFLLYLQSLSDAFATIGWVFSSLTQAIGAADKVCELLNRKPKLRTPTIVTIDEDPASHPSRVGILGIAATKSRTYRTIGHTLNNTEANGEIILQDVVLYYPARPNRRVLNGVSLTIKPGSVVALVGQSGGGKSSVMSLIQHMYEPQSGRVIIDGYDVHELCPNWLSRHISIVSQEPTLFARSIKKNIMYGLDGTPYEPTDDEIIEAAKLANAHNFIMDMPLKYDTEVGERGVQLSGGQKQRIAIARALVRKPRILLLDEATSALDAESEHLVQQSIDDMITRGKCHDNDQNTMTVVIVAHRLSTVRSADTIFVIKDGQVVEHGSHDELTVDTTGAYSNLIRRQMEAQQLLDTTK